MNDHHKTTAQMLAEVQMLRQALAEEKLRKEHLQVAHELSPDAFTILRCVRDTSGQIVDFTWDYVNPAAATLLRRTQDDLVGQRLLSVLPGNQTRSALFAEYMHVVETGEPMDRELYYNADGIDGWFWNKTVKLGDGVANFFANITTRKRLEDLERQGREAAESTLRAIVSATSLKTGIDYCQSLVQFLGTELGIRYAFIGKLAGPNNDHIRTLAFWKSDGLGDNFQYELAGTPCETVVGQQMRHYLRGVADLFPRDGDLKTLQVQCYLGVPLFDKAGRPLGTLVVMDDKEQGTDPLNEPALLQTVASRVAAELERMRAEEALRISDERWQLALRGSNAGVWDWNPRTDEVFFSTRWKTMLGFSDEEIGTTFNEWSDRVHPDDVPRVTRALEEHCAKKTDFYESEHRMRCKDGSYKWILDRGQALWDADGTVARVVGSQTDITERKQAEDWINSLIDVTQDAVISIDRQGRVVRFNPSAERMFGYSQAEICGQKVNLLMPAPYADEHDSYIARYEETHVPHAIGRIRAVTAQRKTGEPFPIELSVTEIGTDDNVRYAAFIRDISDKVRLQEQLLEKERLAAIGVTAAKFAHEIGNPLNGMYAQLQLLDRRLQRQREVLDEKVASDMRGIVGEVQRLSQLLHEFRSLSRHQSFNRQPTDIATVVGTVLEAEAANYRLKGIAVEHHGADDLPVLMIDRDKFVQVLLNLCKNAVEAMPNGGTLAITEYNSGGRVTVKISDTGTGIPDGINIFEPFVTTKPEGTGLGLPIVRQIIAGHGGTLAYTSEPGKGTTFSISLPVVASTP